MRGVRRVAGGSRPSTPTSRTAPTAVTSSWYAGGNADAVRSRATSHRPGRRRTRRAGRHPTHAPRQPTALRAPAADIRSARRRCRRHEQAIVACGDSTVKSAVSPRRCTACRPPAHRRRSDRREVVEAARHEAPDDRTNSRSSPQSHCRIASARQAEGPRGHVFDDAAIRGHARCEPEPATLRHLAYDGMCSTLSLNTSVAGRAAVAATVTMLRTGIVGDRARSFGERYLPAGDPEAGTGNAAPLAPT